MSKTSISLDQVNSTEQNIQINPHLKVEVKEGGDGICTPTLFPHGTHPSLKDEVSLCSINTKMEKPIHFFESQVSKIDGGGAAAVILFQDQVIYKKVFGIKRKQSATKNSAKAGNPPHTQGQNSPYPSGDGARGTLESGAHAELGHDEPWPEDRLNLARPGFSPHNDITFKTLFPLASVSKSVSAALIAYLVKKKKFSFDDSISSIVEGISPQVELKHLLSHTSGIQDTYGNQAIEEGMIREKIIEKVLKKKPIPSPGSYFFYSNIIFSLLENMVQAKAHSSFKTSMEEFLGQIGIQNEKICDVNETDDIAFPHTSSNHTQRYKKTSKRSLHLSSASSNSFVMKNLPDQYPKTVCSAAGIFLSIDNTVNFIKLLLGYYPNILSHEDIQPLFEPVAFNVKDIFRKWKIHWPFPVSELESDYALGWRILRHKKNRNKPLIFHGGYISGVRAFVGIIPDQKIGYAFLMNRDDLLGVETALEIWKQLIQ